MHEYCIDIVRQRIYVRERFEMIRAVLYLDLGSLVIGSTYNVRCILHSPNHTGATVIALVSTVYGKFQTLWENYDINIIMKTR